MDDTYSQFISELGGSRCALLHVQSCCSASCCKRPWP